MNYSVAAVVLMLISLPYIFGDAWNFTQAGESFNCTRYIDFVMKEYSCRPRGFYEISFEENGIITGKDLLQEIQRICSNETVIETYSNCMSELEAECPEQYPLVARAVEKKLSTICDGTNVHLWLLMTIKSGFTYAMECKAEILQIFYNCSAEVLTPYNISSGVSLSTALDVIRVTFPQIFYCTNTNFLQASASFDDCGNSRKEMLLTVWLQNLASLGFGIYLADMGDFKFMEQFQAILSRGDGE